MNIVDWYLIRHAPVLGAGNKLYKSGDEPADLSDGARLDRLARALPEGADWRASPLRRTRATAEALASRKDDQPAVLVDPLLVEQDFGDWFGLGFDALWPKIEGLPPHNWSILAADSRPPGGESFEDVWERVGLFLARNSPAENQTPKIIVSHAGVIRAIIGHILGLTPDRALSFAVDTLSVSHLQYCDQDFRGGHWRLVRMNGDDWGV